MVELDRTEAYKIEALFSYTNDTLVLSFLQNCMGRGWTDCIDNPTCAQILVGDFCFLAGDWESPEAKKLVKNIPPDYQSPYLLIIPENEAWGSLVETCHQGKFNKTLRYAIKKEKDCFTIETLQGFVGGLAPEYQITRIDKKLYYETLQYDFSKDWCSQFLSAEDYLQRGIGFCILHNREIVCGASSYTIYNGGIEIQVDTKNEYKHRGLATACAAKLIVECLKRGLYPSWDAQNKISVALAEKLGYHFDFAYTTYEIDCN